MRCMFVDESNSHSIEWNLVQPWIFHWSEGFWGREMGTLGSLEFFSSIPHTYIDCLLSNLIHNFCVSCDMKLNMLFVRIREAINVVMEKNMAEEKSRPMLLPVEWRYLVEG